MFAMYVTVKIGSSYGHRQKAAPVEDMVESVSIVYLCRRELLHTSPPRSV
jgi:hypothetical protein